MFHGEGGLTKIAKIIRQGLQIYGGGELCLPMRKVQGRIRGGSNLPQNIKKYKKYILKLYENFLDYGIVCYAMLQIKKK